jgi:hypothetical protein
MTREKALQVDRLLCKIEAYEALIEEITRLPTLEEIYNGYGENLEEELIAVVQPKLYKLLKELEEL